MLFSCFKETSNQDEQMVIALALVIISNHSGLISKPFPGFWGPLLSKEAENARSAFSEFLLCSGLSTGHRLCHPRPSPDFDGVECCRQEAGRGSRCVLPSSEVACPQWPEHRLALGSFWLKTVLPAQPCCLGKNNTTLGPRSLLAHLAHSLPTPSS